MGSAPAAASLTLPIPWVLDPEMPLRAPRLARLLLLACLAMPGAPRAQLPAALPPPTIGTEQAQHLLDLLKDDKRRGEFVTTLEALTKAAPAPTILPLKPNSLGAQVVVQVTDAASAAGAQLLASLEAVNDLPLLWRWLAAQASDPEARARLGDAAWKLAVILACALLADFSVRRSLRRLRGRLALRAPQAPDPDPAQPEPESGLAAAEAGQTELLDRRHRLTRALDAFRRLPYLLGRLALDLLPISAFLLVGYLLLGTGLGRPERTRLVVLEAVQAYAACRVILAFAAMLVSPATPRLRLLHVSDWAAEFLTRWIRRLVIIAVVAVATTDIGLLFGMYRTAHDAVLKLFALAIHAGLIVAVLQTREPVAAALRARQSRSPILASGLGWLAGSWHLITVFYLAALWLVWAVELRNGYIRLIQFCLVTICVLVASRLVAVVLLGGLDRLRGLSGTSANPGFAGRANVYFPILRGTLLAILWCATLLALLQAWGFEPFDWVARGGLGGRVMSAVLLIGFTVVLATLVWELANAGVEAHLARLTNDAMLARAGRLRTLLPMVRTVLLVTIVLVVSLMALSELGVNIAPLLAGAGVVGIAVGFGSQRLVQDLITGLFLLLENAMQVGDVVTLASLTGTVEALSIRAIRLRALDGAVHLIPFSAVTTVTNQTRDYGYAVLDVGIGLNEEPDPIADVLREVAASMQADPAWNSMILEPLDVMGVEKFTDLAWIMRIRIKTQPGSRWAVARELNRRIKISFDELAIESPLTSHRVLSTTPPPPMVPKPQPEEVAL